MTELLLGCGNHREKILRLPDSSPGWTDLTTLDNDPNCDADVEWDLNRNIQLPFNDEQFDEIHAYHVLEHLGSQGDYRRFFWEWEEFYRLLKPDGHFFGIVPCPGSPWVFGDPGHTRFIPPEMLTFLDQTEYTNQVGVTAFADYRRFYRADFEKVMEYVDLENGGQFFFIVKAIKPSRISL